MIVHLIGGPHAGEQRQCPDGERALEIPNHPARDYQLHAPDAIDASTTVTVTRYVVSPFEFGDGRPGVNLGLAESLTPRAAWLRLWDAYSSQKRRR